MGTDHFFYPCYPCNPWLKRMAMNASKLPTARCKPVLRILQLAFCVLQFALTLPAFAEESAGNSLESREEAALKAAVETVAPSVVQIRTIGGFDSVEGAVL